MMLPKRLVEGILRPFDNEDTELILRWRMWTKRWFPYRLAEFKAEESLRQGKLVTGPWKWQAPDKWRDWRRKRHG